MATVVATPILCDQGQTVRKRFRFLVRDPDYVGTPDAATGAGYLPLDCTGCTIRSQVRTKTADELLAEPDAVFVDEAGGIAEGLLTSAQSVDLPVSVAKETLIWAFEIVDADAETAPEIHFTLKIAKQRVYDAV
jgi:hypothetical protein